MSHFVRINEAAKLAQTESDYLHKLVKREELPARYELKGRLKYWYVDIESPRFIKLLDRLDKDKKTTTAKAASKRKLYSGHCIDWHVWEAMCKRGEEIVSRGCSDRTIRNYKYYIERFFSSYEYLNRDTLRAALVAYEERETPETDFYAPKSHLYFALMTVAKYFVHCGLESHDLIKSLEYMRPKKKRTVVTRKCYTETVVRDTVKEIQSARTKKNAPAYSDYNAALNTALIFTAFFTGARSSEICGIRLQDVDFQKGSIRLFGKGGKERFVGMSLELQESIRFYLTFRPPEREILFLSDSGKPLRAAYLHRRIKRAGKWINEDLAPHALRRTSITWMLNHKKLPMPLVRDAVGHSSLAVTNIYTKPTANDVIDAMKGL